MSVAVLMFARLLRWLSGSEPDVGGCRGWGLIGLLGSVVGVCKFPYLVLELIPCRLAVATRGVLRPAIAVALLTILPALGWLQVGQGHVPPSFKMPGGEWSSRCDQPRYIGREPLRVAWGLVDTAISQSERNLVDAMIRPCPIGEILRLALLFAALYPFLVAASEVGPARPGW